MDKHKKQILELFASAQEELDKAEDYYSHMHKDPRHDYLASQNLMGMAKSLKTVAVLAVQIYIVQSEYITQVTPRNFVEQVVTRIITLVARTKPDAS